MPAASRKRRRFRTLDALTRHVAALDADGVARLPCDVWRVGALDAVRAKQLVHRALRPRADFCDALRPGCLRRDADPLSLPLTHPLQFAAIGWFGADELGAMAAGGGLPVAASPLSPVRLAEASAGPARRALVRALYVNAVCWDNLAVQPARVREWVRVARLALQRRLPACVAAHIIERVLASWTSSVCLA